MDKVELVGKLIITTGPDGHEHTREIQVGTTTYANPRESHVRDTFTSLVERDLREKLGGH